MDCNEIKVYVGAGHNRNTLLDGPKGCEIALQNVKRVFSSPR